MRKPRNSRTVKKVLADVDAVLKAKGLSDEGKVATIRMLVEVHYLSTMEECSMPAVRAAVEATTAAVAHIPEKKP